MKTSAFLLIAAIAVPAALELGLNAVALFTSAFRRTERHPFAA